VLKDLEKAATFKRNRDKVQKLLHLTAMDRVFKIFGSEEEALRQFHLSATSTAA
jgi:anti-anti-sigma regulatory factor